jgi:hypothetical protein
MHIESWKRSDITVEQYVQHLTTVHAGMVRIHGQHLGFERYVQNPRIEDDALQRLTLELGWSAAPSGAVDLWFRNEGDLAQSTSTDEGREANAILKEDELRFIDPARISAFLAQEELVLEGGVHGDQTGPKLVLQLSTRVGADPSNVVDAVVSRIRSSFAPGEVRCVAGLRVPSEDVDRFARDRGWRTPYDAVIELWWMSDVAMREATSHGVIAKVLADSSPDFIGERTSCFRSKDIVAYDRMAHARSNEV